jgi:hypothetical protein
VGEEKGAAVQQLKGAYACWLPRGCSEASEGQGQQINPGEPELQGQLGELLFDQAVGPFNLTRGLGVVRGVEPPSDGQVLTNQLSDLGNEGRAVVRLETLWKTKTGNDVTDECWPRLQPLLWLWECLQFTL